MKIGPLNGEKLTALMAEVLLTLKAVETELKALKEEVGETTGKKKKTKPTKEY